MLEIGTLVDGKYRILDIVGQGGMSVVYLARNERANKSWAIKEVRKTGTENLEVKQNSLIAETEMLKKLSHPYLPAIVDVIETEDTYLVVMDYIEGTDLNKVLKENGAQDQEKVIEWAKELCDVLGYLHTRTPPIIYRDLKPANVMLKPDGKITLIDFGTAREIKVKDAADTVSLGTRGYAAPEQFGANAKTDARTDIYCLGATIYHLVTNHNPSTEPYVMEPIRQRIPTLSGGLEKIILKCTQPRPQDRYQSCAELMYALEHYEKEDESHRKKQIRKLGIFIASIVMTFICLAVTVFGYNAAENVKTSNYDLQIDEAGNLANDRQSRIKAYQSAMIIDPTRTDAYTGMIDLFLSDESDDANLSGKLESKPKTNENSSEAGYITQLKVGLDNMDSNNNSQGTVMVLDQLKTVPENYAEVCYKIGMAYWYEYTTEDARKTEAISWFNDVVEYGSDTEKSRYNKELAQIYRDIGTCKKTIKDTSRLAEKTKGYEELWDKLNQLAEASKTMTDDEAKILAWEEIVYEMQYELREFTSRLKKPKEDLLAIINDISDSLDSFVSLYPEIDERKTDLLKEINVATDKIKADKDTGTSAPEPES